MAERVRWHAHWVVPVATPPIADGTVITEGDRIVWVGERADAPAAGRDEELGDVYLTPGLINAHTHLDLTVMRGLLDNLEFFPWVRTLTRASATLSAQDQLDSAMLGIAEGLAAGCTTFADTAPNAAPFHAMRAMRVRGTAYHEVFGPDPQACEASLAQLKQQVAVLRPLADDLVQVGVSPHAPFSVSDALYAAVADWAREEQLPVAVHIAESEDEQRLVVDGQGDYAEFLRGRGIVVEPRGREAIELIERGRLLRRGTLLIHAVRVSQPAIGRIASAGCGVAHCPGSNAWFKHGVAPAAAMLESGVRLGVGSDSMASNDRMDMLHEARLAAEAQPLGAEQAFRLATLGGAEALDLDHRVGSLEVGKQADLAVFSAADGASGSADPYAALVLGLRPRTMRVVVAGVERFRDGRVLGFDPAIAERVRAKATDLQRWRREQPPM